MRVALIIVVGLVAIAIPWLFAAFNVTTPALDLPHGYTLQLLNSDFELACPDHSFRTFPFLGVYVGLTALTLAWLIVVNHRRKVHRGFEVEPSSPCPDATRGK